MVWTCRVLLVISFSCSSVRRKRLIFAKWLCKSKRVTVRVMVALLIRQITITQDQSWAKCRPRRKTSQTLLHPAKMSAIVKHSTIRRRKGRMHFFAKRLSTRNMFNVDRHSLDKLQHINTLRWFYVHYYMYPITLHSKTKMKLNRKWNFLILRPHIRFKLLCSDEALFICLVYPLSL